MELFNEETGFIAIPDKVDFDDPTLIREYHRLCGLLRFTPETIDGTEQYTAYCEPDHFVLPLLMEHFHQRFGETSWAIIDEKRSLAALSKGGKKPQLLHYTAPHDKNNAGDEWVNLWKSYHRSINNEARSNPRLQQHFIPNRYRKYLPEME
jgi:probable DNA metabolism protein